MACFVTAPFRGAGITEMRNENGISTYQWKVGSELHSLLQKISMQLTLQILKVDVPFW